MDEIKNQLPDQEPNAPSVSTAGKPSTSGMAIAGLVLGIVAIVTSFLPIINNVSFFLAFVGIILAIVGFVGIRKGKHSGSGIAIAGIVLGILSIIIVLVTQAMFSSALNAASDELTARSTPVAAQSQDASAASGSKAAEAVDYQNLSVGQTVALKSGLSVTVNSIETGLSNYDGGEIVCANVTYANSGSKSESFNVYDWKAEDPDGAQRNMAYYSNAESELSSGTLSAGGSVTGNIYFDAPVAKVLYYGSIIDSEPTAAWLA